MGFFFRRNCPLLFVCIQNSMRATDQFMIIIKAYIFVLLYVHWHYCLCLKWFFEMNFYYSTKMPLKLSLLCIIKLNRRWAKKDRKRFRVQNHVRIIQLLQSVIFLFCFIICRRLMDFNSMFTFDIFQLYCVSFYYYHIFAHDQIETPTANIL